MKISIITALAVFALSFHSCIKDGRSTSESGIPVTISLDAAAMDNNADDYDPEDGEVQEGRGADRTINSLRVLVYKSSNGRLVLNRPVYIEGGTPEKPETLPDYHEIDVRTGTYDFVFVANEHAGGGLDLDAANEAAFDTRTKLIGLKFDGPAFGADEDIPMVKVYPGVTVRGNYLLDYYDGVTMCTVDSTDGTPDAGVWKVPMDRAGIRLSMTIEMPEYLYDVLTPKRIGIGNIPAASYLFPGIDNSALQPDPMVYEYFEASGDEEDGVPGKITAPYSGDENKIYTITYDRIILPELMFTPKDTQDNALVLTMNVDGKQLTAKIFAPEIKGLGYTLPRNTWLHLNVTVDYRTFELKINVLDWTLWETVPGGEIILD